MKNNLNYEFEKQERDVKIRRIIFSFVRFIIEIAAVIGIAYLLVVFTVEQCNMVDSSMSPTIEEGQKILINKLAFRTGEIERYDLIVFKQSGGEHMYYNIKRVIGLPGETITIFNGEIYVDGEMLLEPIKVDPMLLPGFGEEGITLEEDEYFVLGDNRNDSEDSRFSTVGNVSYDDIIGLAWIRISPFSLINKSNKNYVRPTPTPYGYEPSPTPTPTPKPVG